MVVKMIAGYMNQTLMEWLSLRSTGRSLEMMQRRQRLLTKTVERRRTQFWQKEDINRRTDKALGLVGRYVEKSTSFLIKSFSFYKFIQLWTTFNLKSIFRELKIAM